MHLSCRRLLPRQLSFSSCIRKSHPRNMFPLQISNPLQSEINVMITVMGGEVCHECHNRNLGSEWAGGYKASSHVSKTIPKSRRETKCFIWHLLNTQLSLSGARVDWKSENEAENLLAHTFIFTCLRKTIFLYSRKVIVIDQVKSHLHCSKCGDGAGC